MNENYSWKDDQLTINSKILLLFHAPLAVWYTGMAFFLQQSTITLFNYTSFSTNKALLLLSALMGILLSFVMIAIFPKLTVWMERIALPISFLLTILLLMPLPSSILIWILYGNVFICGFSFSTAASVACHLLTAYTNWRNSLFGVAISSILLALLKNDFIRIGFDGFSILAIFLICMAGGFFYLIPSSIKVPMAQHRDRVKLPQITFIGILLLIGLSVFTSTYTVAFAAKAKHGLTFMYGATAIFAILALGLWKAMKSNAIKLFSICFIMLIVGILLSGAAVINTQFYLVSCVLMGFSLVASGIFTALLSTAFSMYPTRYIAIVGTVIYIASIFISLGVQRLLTQIPIILVSINVLVAAILACVYFVMIKYLVYAFDSKTLGTNIKLVGRPFSMPHKVQSTRERHRFDVLTKEELMIVKLLLEGHTDHSIAKNMSLEDETEEEYRENLYKKLNVRFKTKLFRIVAKHPYEF